MESTEITLEALLGAAARGDRPAFAELYRRTAPRLFGLALVVVKRREWAEEVLQDAFVAVWRRAADFSEEKGSANAWLATIVRHRAIDRLRREPITVPADSVIAGMIDESPDAPAQLELSQAARRIEGCLGELDESQRRAIRFAYYEGLTHVELAARMDSPLGTVKSWIRRGLERLRECFGDER